MKKITNIVLSASFILIIISCGSSSIDPNLPPAERIQGTWKITKADGAMEKLNVGTIYKWEGKTMTTSKSDFETTGEFTITDSTITWYPGTIEMNYKYHFNNNTLIFDFGGGQEFHLEKE